MPDLGNFLNSPALALTHCPRLKYVPEQCDSSTALSSIPIRNDNKLFRGEVCTGGEIGVVRQYRGPTRKLSSRAKSLDEYVKAWLDKKKTESSIPEWKCFLPFLVGAPRLVECFICQNIIYPADEVLCSIRGCRGVYHRTCAKASLGFSSSKQFKCPQHACYLCKLKVHLWRCMRCPIASHDKCAAFPEHVIFFHNRQGQTICWRHPTDWRLEKKDSSVLLYKQLVVPANDMQEIFCHLPLPYVEEEFKIDITWKDMIENKVEPPPYVHIKRNVYLIKKKREDNNVDIGCTNCSSTCSEDCVCRVQCISCSKVCRCSETCSNRPFRKEKKITIVKTELCGWGVVAGESINKGDFVIEYIGEVIDDALCEQRLWDMKFRGVKNFYMCEIRKDFTIDATFKGNSSRFLNHSCDPNCKLEKWQVEGGTRIGVFAARAIEVGEPLTYDYRFVQFGQETRCHCGSSNCQGYLGIKRKIGKLSLCWGSKRRRTSTACLAIIKY